MSEQAREEEKGAENGQPPQQQQQQQQQDFLSRENIHVELTSAPLCITKVMDRIRSPKAGALVLFAGIIPPSLLPPLLQLTGGGKIQEPPAIPSTTNPSRTSPTPPTHPEP